MARNPVQFQQGPNLATFTSRYGRQEQCHAALIQMRWPVITGGGRPAGADFTWVNIGLGNIKSAITGTCRSCRPQHAERYLAAYEYRFNRHFALDKMVERFVSVAAKPPRPPQPHQRFKPAEMSG